ncbi:GNAT family protein [Hymenobacter sp. GOD-10R]|uniref:GNAT family N-acetyltransferase n=1 Tax=Hymenobacter sp. GOD-10R TaxID=3093922 RepID=UPI002D771E9F|nr:GNAT family protein [Hymenobacter sp. GOD-10R]WRQ31992.1 GNAT family protein [Hymenobacter sp. GOD-10R]
MHYTSKTVEGPRSFTGTHTLFLIRNDDRVCVAAIQDAGQWDLHWVVDPAYRGQGLLTAALRDELLPYLLRSRPWQQVTVSYGVAGEYYEASQKVARQAGFKAISTTDDEVVYRINAEDLVADPVP